VAKLFDRQVRVVIHRLELTGLRVAFQIEKSLRKAPNRAEIRVWNLNAEHQRQLQEQRDIPVQLQAGYVQPPLSSSTEAALAGIGLERAQQGLPTLYQGDLRRAFTGREGPDWVTTISSGDGEKAGQRQRVKMNFRPGLRWRKLLQDMASAAGVGLGNALSALGGLVDLEVTTGTALSGSALDQLDQMLQSQGFEMSVQGGELQVLGSTGALKGKAVLLSEATGLVDSPEPGNDGKIKVRSLLQPGLEPGRLVRLEAKRIGGNFRVERWTGVGDTHGQDWYAEVELGQVSP